MADDDDEVERPMTEEEWEQQFRESDIRAARYGDLLETLMDHPDRDAIVAREMGWHRLADEGDAEDEEDDEPFSPLDFEPDEETLEELRREDEELEKMPAYRLALEATHAVWDALRPYSSQHAEGSDASDLFAEAIGNAAIPGAKIAGGHGMGYEDDVLCGNIVCNKRALEAARATIDALQQLREQELVPAGVAEPLVTQVQAVVEAIETRIAELRSRVWW